MEHGGGTHMEQNPRCAAFLWNTHGAEGPGTVWGCRVPSRAVVGGKNFRGEGPQTAHSLTSHKMKIFKFEFYPVLVSFGRFLL